jgi:hypothetical protein
MQDLKQDSYPVLDPKEYEKFDPDPKNLFGSTKLIQTGGVYICKVSWYLT